jgi:Flp pilus assembly protein TadG
MMGRSAGLRGSEGGASAVEFALVAPAFVALLIGTANVGTFFFANSGLKSAVAEGARFASIHPRPTNEAIIARITDRRFGMNPADIVAPTVTDCTHDGTPTGRPCVDIQMGYQVKMNFIFVKSASWSTFDLTERRRVFVYPAGFSAPSPAAPATPATPATPTSPTTPTTPTNPTPVDPVPVDPVPETPECEKKNGKCK